MINKQTHDKIKTLLDLGLIKDYNLFVNEALNEKLDNLQKKKRFKEPTVDEVYREMFLKLHSLLPNLTEPEIHRASNLFELQLQANKFVNFYGSKNWMVGKNKMSKWKLAAFNWIIRVIEDSKKLQTKNSSDEVTNTDLFKNL